MIYPLFNELHKLGYIQNVLPFRKLFCSPGVSVGTKKSISSNGSELIAETVSGDVICLAEDKGVDAYSLYVSVYGIVYYSNSCLIVYGDVIRSFISSSLLKLMMSRFCDISVPYHEVVKRVFNHFKQNLRQYVEDLPFVIAKSGAVFKRMLNTEHVYEQVYLEVFKIIFTV